MNAISSPPRAARTSVMLRAHLFRHDRAEATDHRVVNVSETGLCITHPDALKPGTAVIVSIGQVDHAPADVVWVRGGLAGLKFQEPIDATKARARRLTSGAGPAPASGWISALNNPYRR